MHGCPALLAGKTLIYSRNEEGNQLLQQACAYAEEGKHDEFYDLLERAGRRVLRAAGQSGKKPRHPLLPDCQHGPAGLVEAGDSRMTLWVVTLCPHLLPVYRRA